MKETNMKTALVVAAIVLAPLVLLFAAFLPVMTLEEA
jgi:hypothetical protein